jgi:hypothetical protein
VEGAKIGGLKADSHGEKISGIGRYSVNEIHNTRRSVIFSRQPID